MLSNTRVVQHESATIGETLHMGLVGVHTVCSVAALALSVTFIVYGLGGTCSPDSCQSMLFITSTFLSTRRVESNVGWPVATERTLFKDPTKQYPLIDGTSYTGYGFTHFYECMYSARMADTTCNFFDSGTFTDYYACMTNSTPNPVKTALSACNVFPTVSNYSHYMTSEDYITCLNWQPALRNSISTRASRNVFRSCLAKAQWPFAEYQLDVDTPAFLGSYNWALFLAIGFAVMTSFAVYSMSWREDGPVRNGEPTYFMRLGLFWAWTAWIWNLGLLVICLLIAFRETGSFESNGGLPTTVSTTLVTLGLLALVLVYFGSELFTHNQWEFLAHALEGTGYHKIVKHRAYKRFFSKDDAPLLDPSGGRGELGSIMPGASRSYVVTDPEVAKYYTPPLLSTWADGYIADAVIFLGVAGATQQLTTDQAWNIFVLIGAYRLLNMMIARFMYECFMNNFSLEQSVNESKFKIKPVFLSLGDPDRHSDPHLSVRVMALSTQIAAIYLYIAIIYLFFNGNVAVSSFDLFNRLTIFGFLVPEAIRIALHVYYQVWYSRSKGSSWLLLNTHMFVWNWDLVCRFIILSIILLNTDGGFQGTREYLLRQSNTLLRDFLVSFA
jgi:hypothetical protein